MAKIKHILSLALTVSFCGCYNAGESTTMGAAAGGALGAGLGAIVGSQTGDAGAGVAIGAAAGAASGALIGNAIDGQQEAIRTQDEAIERQDRLIASQRTEIEDLRRIKDDSYGRGRLASPKTLAVRDANTFDKNGGLNATQSKPLSEKDIVTKSNISKAPVERLPDLDKLPSHSTAKLSDAPPLPNTKNKTAKLAPAAPKSMPNSKECKNANGEFEQAQTVSDSADKLFHMRRALRLCPDSAFLHYELGRLYQKLERPSDAEFEFKEALSVEPSFGPAQRAVAAMSEKPKSKDY